MATVLSFVRPSCRSVKRLKTSFISSQTKAAFSSTYSTNISQSSDVQANESSTALQTGVDATGLDIEASSEIEPRLPRGLQAVYLKPLKRQATHGIPCCDLQLRSYSVRNVEFYADFALRAAYYLNLPASGPTPLPKIVERWTVPKGHFVHKKTQENFERVTLRRLIQIQDGHPDTIDIWLAYLKKHAFYGVGMKANVWRYDQLGVGERMEVAVGDLQPLLESTWAQFAQKPGKTSKGIADLITSESSRIDREMKIPIPR